MDSVAADRLLVAAGLRRTPARREVLAWMSGRAAAVSHGELELRLPHLDRVTVYRVLQSFEEKGLAHRVVDASGTARFALNGAAEEPGLPHFHFQCLGCGAVRCLPGGIVARPPLPAGFVLEGLTLSAQGWCSACAASDKRN